MRGGTGDNFLASDSETFDGDAFDTRLDARFHERLNLFGRYSVADFRRIGPTAFGPGGGPAFVTLGGTSKSRNHSLALGSDATFSPMTVADFRVGFFRYKVDVRSAASGMAAAPDPTIPGLNLDALSSGLPEGFIDGPGGFVFGFGGGANFCNCPLVQDEKQLQLVGNLTHQRGTHTLKFGADVRRAYNLRVASEPPRQGALSFSVNRTRGPDGGGLGLASFLLGDVTSFSRTTSQTLDARERQWRHFYYGQDTWRLTPKLTLGYGLRLELINPQTVNAPGHGGFLDLDTGEIKVAGVGGIGLDGDVRNTLNWAPRAGITYRLGEMNVIRAGYGRSYDIGVFGSTFGHSVTQNVPVLLVQTHRAAIGFRERLQPGGRSAAAALPRGASERPLSAAQGHQHLRVAGEATAARRGRLQRHRPASAHEHSLSRGRLRRQQGDARLRGRFSDDRPESANARGLWRWAGNSRLRATGRAPAPL